MRLKTTLFFLLMAVPAIAQKSLKFSELLTFGYVENGKPKETSVYLDRKTSTWLFTNDDTFGGTAEGLSFVVAYPTGTYLLCGTDDSGVNNCQRYRRSVTKLAPKTITSGGATGPQKTFGRNNYGWPTLAGKPFTREAGRMEIQVYLATVSFNCSALYAYNFLIGLEFPLPIFRAVNYADVVLPNQLVVSEVAPIGATLKSLSPTEYFLDLRGYRIHDAKP